MTSSLYLIVLKQIYNQHFHLKLDIYNFNGNVEFRCSKYGISVAQIGHSQNTKHRQNKII